MDKLLKLLNKLVVTGDATFSGDTALNGDVRIGNSSSDKIAFYGSAPVVKPVVGNYSISSVDSVPSGLNTSQLNYYLGKVKDDVVAAMDDNTTKQRRHHRARSNNIFC